MVSPDKRLTSEPTVAGLAGCHQRIAVSFDYPVVFARNVFDPANALLAGVLNRRGEDRRHRAVVYVDSGVAEAHGGLLGRIKDYFHAHREGMELSAPPQVVPGGEAAKTDWAIVRDVMTTIGNLHLDRQSVVIGIGGGSVLDMLGFAASVVHRGLRMVRLPTTTLAMDDAGIGVKNGMDEHGMKNFVGTFAPPFAVVNDWTFLPTLRQKDWIAGAAEAFKVAIIKDAAFFDHLCADAAALRRRDMPAMERTVEACATLHLEHIRTSGDPFEFGSARPLDFGHWAAHKLESLSGYTLGHGQAVAVGIALDSVYARRQGLLTDAETERILGGLEACGLPVWDDLLESTTAEGLPVVMAGIEEFREHLGGVLNVTLPDGLGRKVEVHAMNPDDIVEAAKFLKRRVGSNRNREFRE